MEYLPGSPGSKPAWSSFYRCQNLALRVITGQLQATPVEMAGRKTGVCSMTASMRRQTDITFDKAARLASDHPVAVFLTLLSVQAGARLPKSLMKKLPNTLT